MSGKRLWGNDRLWQQLLGLEHESNQRSVRRPRTSLSLRFETLEQRCLLSVGDVPDEFIEPTPEHDADATAAWESMAEAAEGDQWQDSWDGDSDGDEEPEDSQAGGDEDTQPSITDTPPTPLPHHVPVMNEVFVEEDSGGLVLSTAEHFAAILGADIELEYATAWVSDNDLLSALDVDSSTGELSVAHIANGTGVTEIVVQATTPTGETALAAFVVHVLPTNDPPEIEDLDVEEGPTHWKIEGRVDDEDPLGLAVVIRGVESEPIVLSCQQDGSFYLVIGAPQQDLVLVDTVDIHGLTSEQLPVPFGDD